MAFDSARHRPSSISSTGMRPFGFVVERNVGPSRSAVCVVLDPLERNSKLRQQQANLVSVPRTSVVMHPHHDCSLTPRAHPTSRPLTPIRSPLVGPGRGRAFEKECAFPS
jgi:hypothetical protein